MRSAHDTTSPSGVVGVERLGAEVEVGEGDVGPPHRVVVAALDERAQRVLAGVAAGAVTAVVPEGDGLGEGDVQPGGARDAGRDLGDLEGVGEPRALVVLGEDEHLRLAVQPAERRCVEDAIAIALEARAVRVRRFVEGPVAGARCSGRAGGQQVVLVGFASVAIEGLDGADHRAAVGVGQPEVGGVVARHRRRPTPLAVGHLHGGPP
jgi:hypothetical protein